MAAKAKAVKARSKAKPAADSDQPPAPFKAPPEVLQPFIEQLSPQHVYITHVDLKPVAFKRKIFLVPVGMNIAVVLLFIARMWWIAPWYFKLVAGSFGQGNDLHFEPSQATWQQIAWEAARRGLTLMVDFILLVFVWPWPVEFAFGRTHGNPVQWRLKVGFREKEIYVRRSRDWDKQLGDIFKETEKKNGLMGMVRQASSPLLQHEKTGYLTMNGEWDLDWEAMVQAHGMVDKKDVAIDAFRSVVLVHHKEYGWMTLSQANPEEKMDDQRRKVFEFRDALAAIGKENLFYRWIEIVQYESSQPGGFGSERQAETARQIQDLFAKEDLDFDKFWADSVGGDAFA